MLLPLVALEKDRAGVDTGLLTVARNCYPNTVGWGPMPSLSENGTSTLPDDCRGLFFARTTAGAYLIFAATATKLYKLVGGSWQDYTRTSGGNYATQTGYYWQGVQWGSLLILVNGIDVPQVLDVDSGATAFSALAGSPPVATHVSIVGDFVFLLDATNRRRLIHCGTTGPNTATSWTLGTDLCDEYIAPDGGSITSPPMLGEYGLFLQDDGVARRVILQPGDPDTAFRYEKMEGIKGAVSGYNKIAAGGKIYYLAEDGVYSLGTDGSNVAVGAQRINDEWRQTSDQTRLDRFYGFADPFSNRIYWAYYQSGASTQFDGLLGYDYQLDRLFFVEQTAQFWAPLAIPGQSLEDISAIYANIDTMVVSLDARQFQGGRPTIGAVNTNRKLVLLNGPHLKATWRISPTHLVPGARALLSEVYPVGDWGVESSLELLVSGRRHGGMQTTWHGPYTPSAETGRFYPRVSAHIHELELRATRPYGRFAQALQTTEQPDGLR